jgi:aerobic-type carbon monoxide dehydrogenase small subunit (CoxS/CutS family)
METPMAERFCDIRLHVNGEDVRERIEARKTLVDFLRDDLGLTGSHIGCEQGVCGACTVRVDGAVVRGCLMLAVQCDGAEVETIEGMSDSGTAACQVATQFAIIFPATTAAAPDIRLSSTQSNPPPKDAP